MPIHIQYIDPYDDAADISYRKIPPIYISNTVLGHRSRYAVALNAIVLHGTFGNAS